MEARRSGNFAFDGAELVAQKLLGLSTGLTMQEPVMAIVSIELAKCVLTAARMAVNNAELFKNTENAVDRYEVHRLLLGK